MLRVNKNVNTKVWNISYIGSQQNMVKINFLCYKVQNITLKY